MKRYVISPVVNSGQSVSDGYRASVANVPNTTTISLIKIHPETGVLTWNFAFSRVAVPGTLQTVLQVSNSYVFPDFPLDAQMSTMDFDIRTALVQNVQAYNMDGLGTNVDATHADTDSYRTVIEKIARQWQPVFVADHFDVPETV